MQQKTFEDIKIELCANPLVQPYRIRNEATVTTDVSEKLFEGFFRKKDIQLHMYPKKLQRSKTFQP